jgi:DNA-binding CsgD family transcriptional regulator
MYETHIEAINECVLKHKILCQSKGLSKNIFRLTNLPQQIFFLELKHKVAIIEKNNNLSDELILSMIQIYKSNTNEIFADRFKIKFYKLLKQHYVLQKDFENALSMSDLLYYKELKIKNEIIKIHLKEIEKLIQSKLNANKEKDSLLDYKVNGLYYLNHSNSSRPSESSSKINNDLDYMNRTQIIQTINKIQANIPTLTSAEARVAALLINHLNTKEITQILGVSIAAIKKHRLNIRKKMGLNEENSLTNELINRIQ